MLHFVHELQQVGGFLRVLRLLHQNKTDRHDIAEILLDSALNTITQPRIVNITDKNR